MSVSNLFLNKAYILPLKNGAEESELELVGILLKSLTPSINATNIKFVSTNDDYDIYRYTHENYDFCIKISLDPDCKKINHESLNIQKINPLIRPQYIKDGTIKIGDNLRYIITSFENAESLKSLGRSQLTENFESFCNSYLLMQNSESIPYSYKDTLSEYFESADLNNSLTEDAVESIKKYTDFDLIQEILNELKNELLTSYNEIFSEKSFICHGKLNINNIISKNNLFKFINFDNCYSSHCFIDLSELIIELGIPSHAEILMIEKFCDVLKIEFNKHALKNYNICYKISLIKKALELIVSYLKEIYLYSSYRNTKIIDIADKFSQCFDRFMKIDILNENKEFILKTLTEPILNEKA
jgi:hypothetical protein